MGADVLVGMRQIGSRLGYESRYGGWMRTDMGDEVGAEIKKLVGILQVWLCAF